MTKILVLASNPEDTTKLRLKKETEWYEMAVKDGLVLDIPINNLNLDGYNQLLVKVARPCLSAHYTQMPWREAKAEMESWGS